MKEWIKNTLQFAIGILIIIGIMFAFAWFKYHKMDVKKQVCIQEYKSNFDSINGDWEVSDRCESQICESMNLKLSGFGNWAKAIFYCTTEHGGELEVDMPQHSKDEECDNYFLSRWNQAVCLSDAGYLEDLT